MLTFPKTQDKPTESTQDKVTSTPLNLGELVVQWQEFQEFPEVVPTEVVRVPLVTNAVKVVCLPH